MVVFDENNTQKKRLRDKLSALVHKMVQEKTDFYQRVVLSVIMAIVSLFVIIIGGFWFNALVVAVSVLSAMEFMHMISHKQQQDISKEDKSDILWLKKIAVPYILIPALSIIFIRESQQGRSIIIWLMLSIWSVDSAGYIIGSLFGKNKLYPKISPNKTIEGALGGILAGLVITVILFPIMMVTNGSNPNGFSFYSMIFLSLTVSVLSIVGDLSESYIKRQCGVKDSGSILLSHGGVMDRMDSLILVAPVIAVLVLMKGGVFF